MYSLHFSSNALEDIRQLKRKYPDTIDKLKKLLKEIQEHPRTGTGKVERLKHYEGEVWSRRINRMHRLVYRINEEDIDVFVLSSFGHYKDK